VRFEHLSTIQYLLLLLRFKEEGEALTVKPTVFLLCVGLDTDHEWYRVNSSLLLTGDGGIVLWQTTDFVPLLCWCREY
jgi:hypothetical protein